MRLEVVAGKFTVWAHVETRENFAQRIPAIDFLRENMPNYGPSVRGLKTMFVRYSELGRQGFTSESLHEVDKSRSVYEFVKGDLRIFCFFPGDGAVVLTNGCIKKGNKVDQSAVESCCRARDQYKHLLK